MLLKKMVLLFCLIFTNLAWSQVSSSPRYGHTNVSLKDLKGKFYNGQNYYRGEINWKKLNIEGGVSLDQNGRNRKASLFFLDHSQGVEAYNFTTRNWESISIKPTDMLLSAAKSQEGRILGSVFVGHVPTVRLKNPKTDIELGIGPAFHLQEFNANPRGGVLFRLRIRLK